MAQLGWEAMAIILRFVDESWTLERLFESMTGEEIARELIHVLSANYAIGPDQLIAVMRDRAAVNGVVTRTSEIVYLKLLDIIDQVGKHFNTPVLSQFSASWIMFFPLIVRRQNCYGKSKLEDL